MTPGRFPLHLDLRDRRVLVVGGGPVALRRATALAEAGGVVVVVAPEIVDGMPGELLHRRFRPTDVGGAWLVVTATGEIDEQIAQVCQAYGIWCVRADDATRSPAWVPAVARVDDVVVSLTAGRDPRRAAALRDAVALALDTGELPLRRSRPGTGSVALVGGGPGDPDLLTVRGRRLLAGADVVELRGGVITGAADDDPSGIATYTQAGAQFGTSVLWTVFLTLPFMIGIQLVSARIGRQSGQGIAANLREHTPKFFLFTIVALLLIANTVQARMVRRSGTAI